MNLADALVPKYYQDKDCIINQGDPGDGMYFVEEGIVNVLVTSETGEQIKVCLKLRGRNTPACVASVSQVRNLVNLLSAGHY